MYVINTELDLNSREYKMWYDEVDETHKGKLRTVFSGLLTGYEESKRYRKNGRTQLMQVPANYDDGVLKKRTYVMFGGTDEQDTSALKLYIEAKTRTLEQAKRIEDETAYISIATINVEDSGGTDSLTLLGLMSRVGGKM